MERAIEEVIRCDADPDRVVELFAHDPAGVLSGRSSTDTSAFVAEMAVPLGGGVSLAHEVDVDFQRLPDSEAVGRFRVAWRARDHHGALPVFGGTLEVHRDGAGSRVRLAGHYSLPLGSVGAVGDRLLGHRIAERSVRAFLEAAAARVDAMVVREVGDAPSAARTADIPVTVSAIRSEFYLG